MGALEDFGLGHIIVGHLKNGLETPIPAVLPDAEIVVQAITVVGATVSLTNRSSREQVVEVELEFLTDGERFASGSAIVRLPTGPNGAFVDVVANYDGPIPDTYTTEIASVNVL